MTKSNKEVLLMKTVKNSLIKKALDKELTKDANSFCLFLYQPKDPKNLKEFKKHNK